MVSFIIPTLWKSEYIYKTIDAIQASSIPGIELIIFDNDQTGYTNASPNITVINDKNYWVNHAWNKGVELAKNEWVCFLNDDVYLNIDLFCREFDRHVIQTEFKKTFGILGFQSGSGFDTEINEDADQLMLANLIHRGTGFGQCMIINKKIYEPIPEEFKIFFGDDYLFYLYRGVLKLDTWYFKGLKFIGNLSTTSNSVEHLIQEELKYWKQKTTELYNKYRN